MSPRRVLPERADSQRAMSACRRLALAPALALMLMLLLPACGNDPGVPLPPPPSCEPPPRHQADRGALIRRVSVPAMMYAQLAVDACGGAYLYGLSLQVSNNGGLRALLVRLLPDGSEAWRTVLMDDAGIDYAVPTPWGVLAVVTRFDDSRFIELNFDGTVRWEPDTLWYRFSLRQPVATPDGGLAILIDPGLQERRGELVPGPELHLYDAARKRRDVVNVHDLVPELSSVGTPLVEPTGNWILPGRSVDSDYVIVELHGPHSVERIIAPQVNEDPDGGGLAAHTVDGGWLFRRGSSEAPLSLLTKTDADGAELWTRELDVSGILLAAPDGNFVLVSRPDDVAAQGGFLVRVLNPDGQEAWSKVYGEEDGVPALSTTTGYDAAWDGSGGIMVLGRVGNRDADTDLGPGASMWLGTIAY